LTLKNEDVYDMNNEILNILEGECKTYYSIDTPKPIKRTCVRPGVCVEQTLAVTGSIPGLGSHGRGFFPARVVPSFPQGHLPSA